MHWIIFRNTSLDSVDRITIFINAFRGVNIVVQLSDLIYFLRVRLSDFY